MIAKSESDFSDKIMLKLNYDACAASCQLSRIARQGSIPATAAQQWNTEGGMR